MRLTQIKLSGFKSFVDPTSFQVPGQLVGVVGPNGCGKSNIIDATRWVLGESKASELRGESMQDVIFNGSTHRKPAGRASVELVFDNAEGKAGGQWSQYAEISVKRTLTRDGTSTYYINNQAVRRRDIQDIFLGTGLGPRAYAIIGQGMISRIIEAKPDELRVFLEEAAGVSKYKERRRETENRLHDTRENLLRVEDILRELTVNVEKLQGQAAVAEKFKRMSAEADEKQKLLWLLRRREAETLRARCMREIEQAQITLDAQTAELRAVEARVEKLRQSEYDATHRVEQAQGELLQVASEVSKLEAEIRFVGESRTRLRQQIATLAAQVRQWAEQRETLSEQLDTAREQAEELDARAAETEERAAIAGENLPALEDAVRDGQQRVGDLRAEAMGVQQQIQLESARQRSLSQSLQQLAARRERLDQEARGLQKPDADRLERGSEQLAMLEARQEELAAQLDDAQAAVPAAEQARAEAQRSAGAESQKQHQVEARLAALRKLQNDVQHRGKLEPWLRKHGLADMPRLWQRIGIDAGWETALEAALREKVAAIEVGDIARAKAFTADPPPAKLTFHMAGHIASAGESPAGFRPLLALVRVTDPALRALLAEWLADVFAAESIDDALAAREKLPLGGIFVTRAGHAVGRASIAFHAADDEQAGMLARQHEIDDLTKESRAQTMIAEEARANVARAEAALTAANQHAADLRQKSQTLTRDAHQLQLEVLKLQQAQRDYEQRSTRIEGELEEIVAQQDEQQAALEASQEAFEQLDERLAEAQGRHEDEQLAQEAREAKLADARNALRDQERQSQEARFAARQQRARIEELVRNVALAAQQAELAAKQRASLELELAAIADDTAHDALQEALARRADADDRLAEQRAERDALAAQLRAGEDERNRIERQLDPARAKIMELQLKEQAARLNVEQYGTQLTEAQADEAALGAKLDAPDADWKPAVMQGDITRLQGQIAALGAVNLAALDELKAAEERKTFLDAQQTDLNEAITTLEDAIRKIDQETRSLLKGTFDDVNKHFGRLFPELFGGGEARLIMTGEEILDAGVQVMAQPPGKRNSTIHLLSGGEKALTAIALVFAIFQLNPAPFCLLDEVDAPLDDANTERYANMVKKMSSVTQFLFISHNKIAMEMAEQLIGVTMQEQGVSRIVAVDIEAAARMAGAEAAAA
ncbi:chromosome segregation protein SMC [Derxia gummosa]|uniref:Chromosome partition protein Smc n=1 Tax=Derxia gummosa DSM 723 TaxID=1121388 RepID=A0A8B6X721_9BURK|nr:chromosome segregation protein SMC [Derxia gummosa]